jgi:hypothetical protein
VSGASGLRKHGHASLGDGGTITGEREVVLTLTNKSGGSVAAGDVVVVDTANDEAFTTTTSAQAEVSLGVVQESIASNAAGRVLVAGYAALVNVPSSMTRGRFIETHTVAKQATGSATRRAGSFGQFLVGGTTPSAWLWGSTDPTAGGGGGGLTPLYTDAGTGSIRLPDDESYTRFSQGDVGDGSQAYLLLDDGDGKLVTTPNGTDFASVQVLSNGNVQLNPKSGATVTINTAGVGRVNITGGNGLVFPVLAADPSSPIAGQTYYNSISHKLRTYDGTIWNDLF